MLKVLLITAILLATDAAAGEIVWRGPTTGVLTVSTPFKPETPEQPALDVHYAPIHVAAGSVVNVTPIGDISGYVFSTRNPLPPALTLNPATGKIAGLAAVAGRYDVTIRVQKDGFSADLVLSLTIS